MCIDKLNFYTNGGKKMKKSIGFFIASLFIITSVLPSVIATYEPSHRGSFYATVGLGNRQEASIELNGEFRDFRDRHIIFGTATLLGSGRSFRFQGATIRSTFIIQSAVHSRIINIVGSFTRYDEITQTFYGQWRGFIAGYSSTRGWIVASFPSSL